MSELYLSVTPSPELLTQPAAAPTRPANTAAESTNPFADLLSGVLAGTQPLAPAPGLSPLGGTPALSADDLPETDVDTPALLALPGSAAALPALADEFVSPGLAGKSLPLAGNPLPVDPSPRAVPVTNLQLPLKDGNAAEPTPSLDETRQRISLTDLALSRTNQPPSAPLEFVRKYLARQSQTTIGAPKAELVAELVAEPRADSASPVPAVRLEFTAGMLAALATGSASNNGLPGPAALAVTGAAGGGNGPLAARQDSSLPTVLAPLGDAGSFAGGLADRLLALGGPGVQTARLQLHPERLGALSVEIQIDDGTAQVWFATTTSQAHSAIEGSLPRLRELFAEQGIALTRTQVDVGAGQMGSAGSDQRRPMAGHAPLDVDPLWRATPPPRSTAIPGLLRHVSSQHQRLDVWA